MIKGHSGCTIDIIDGKIIKKAHSDLYPITRLKQQANKQKEFLSSLEINPLNNIYIPKISGEFYGVEMEYCPSVNILQFLTYANIQQVDDLCDNLISFIKYVHSNSGNAQNVEFDIRKKYLKIKIDCNFWRD